MKDKLKVIEAVINNETQPAVNARELWKALESKQEFSNWIKNRLADFDAGVDYTVDKIINGENKGRFAAIEYTLTLDTAKHLAMLERNEIGKKIRQYFIEVEKEFRSALNENIKFCQRVYADKCAETALTGNIAPGVNASTLELIDCINRRILSGGTVDKEVLRYAWNVGRLVAKQAVSIYPDDLTAFIKSFPAGEFTRNDVYDQYCACCSDPISPRRFWPCVRAIRPCSEKRISCARIVVFK